MPHRKWAVRLIILACFTGVIVAACVFIKYVNAPSQSQIYTPTSSTASLASTTKFNNTPITVHNEYFSFAYPASMHAYTPQHVSSPQLADYSYGYQDIESWQLAVAAQTLAGPSISNDSSYTFRAQHPDQYQLSSININGRPVAIMTDTKAVGFSKVAFILFGSNVVDVSLYGNDTSGTTILNSVFLQVLNSLQWKSK